MPDLDPRWIDVDFPNQPEYTRGDLGVRFDSKMFTRFDEAFDVIPESQWKELAAEMDRLGTGCDQLVTRILNQRNEGSCVANAWTQAHQILQALQFGKANVVQLSAISLYKRIGRSPGSGAMVSDGMDEIEERGILPLDTPENRAKFGDAVMPPTGFYTKYPPNWEATAKKFRGVEFYTIRSVAELQSALFQQFPVVVGRAGHSICYCRPVYRDGTLLDKYANSWGDWGDKGFGYDSMRLIRSSASYCFCLRSIVVN